MQYDLIKDIKIKILPEDTNKDSFIISKEDYIKILCLNSDTSNLYTICKIDNIYEELVDGEYKIYIKLHDVSFKETEYNNYQLESINIVDKLSSDDVKRYICDHLDQFLGDI